MKEELQRIIDLLVSEELTEAKKYIEYRLSRTAKSDVSPRHMTCWHALCSAMRSPTLESNELGFRTFVFGRNGYGIGPYSAAIAALDGYVNQGLDGEQLTRPERMKLYILCFEAILLRIAHKAIPVSARIVLQHTASSLDEAMGWQYPGYYRAKKLHILVKGNKDASREN